MTHRQLEWSTSTLFRIETGRSRPQPGNVRTLLELYGVTGAERDGLIQLTREARQPGWWHSFRDVLPNLPAGHGEDGVHEANRGRVQGPGPSRN
jgi:hypothetical protein